MATYNYQNGKIYTIRSNQTVKYYIGSTVQKTLAQRLGKHRSNYKDYLKDNTKGFLTSFEILKYNDYYIELLEDYPCNSIEQLRKREGELQRQFKSEIVNMNIAGRTATEYVTDNKEQIKERKKAYCISHKEQIKVYNIAQCKAYRDSHKEHLKQQQAQYYESNKEEILQKNKQYNETNKEQISARNKQLYITVDKAKRQVQFNCECGSSGTSHHLLRHNTSKKHLNYIQQQILTTNIETLPIIELAELSII